MPIHKVGISIFLFDIFIYCEFKRLPWPNTKTKESFNYFLLLTTKLNKSKDIDTFEMIFVEQNKKNTCEIFWNEKRFAKYSFTKSDKAQSMKNNTCSKITK